jgi:RNA polymerase sigma-70 factor (ECF subfamily)
VATKEKIEDYQLVQMALSGNQDAFSQILHRYKDSIAFTVGKMIKIQEDKDDIVMEAFSKAFQKLENYKADFAFSTWLYNIAINHTIDFLRKKKLETFSMNQTSQGDDGEEYELNVKDYKPDPEELFIKQQRATTMRSILEKLNPQYRQMIEYRYFDELSYEEISDKMKLPIGTVKGHLHRSKSLLYNILQKNADRI